MPIYNVLTQSGLPVAYSHFKELKEPPYIVYIGSGQDQFLADNTGYHRENRYQVEYYFKRKNETKEEEIESLLLDAGYLYEKSEDIYLEDQDVFMIYYYI